MLYENAGTALKNQIPNNKPRTQSNRAPKHRLRRTPPLRRTLELRIPAPDIRLRRVHVADELGDVFFLGGQVSDECFLEGGDFQEGFLGVSVDD